ncbi:putative ribonuclease H-like domain-containing protein [Tanacetum coccineum]
MDVKSASLYGKIEEEVYVCQPLGFEDPEFPDRVYKVEKTLYGLHQAPRAWYETFSTYLLDNGFQRGLQVTQKDVGIFISQDMYVDEILKKFGFLTVKTTSTPMETSKPLMKDENAEDVDVHLYRSTIVSLMYLTSSRPDIMFAVCTCVRFHVIPKVSHLHVVKRIFRYLKGQPKLGLWYHKDSPFDLEAYTDSDYASASLDRKSTTGGCQFLGSRLILWQCKKQTIVANSTTEVEYMAAASCCRQIQDLVDGKKVIITEISVRRALQLKDAEVLRLLLGTNLVALWPQQSSVLPQTKNSTFLMFLDKQVEGMTKHKEIYVTPSHTKKVFANTKRGGKGFSKRVTLLFQTMMVQAPVELEPITDEAANAEHVPTHSNDPLFSGEDRPQLKEVLDLENTKTSQAAEITKLKERVKKLERRNKSRTPGLKRLRKVGRSAQVFSSEDEGLGAQEDAFKQGRKIANLDADAEEVEVEKVVSTAEVTTASATTTVDELTLAQNLIEVKAAKPKAVTTATITTTIAVTRLKARGVVVQEPKEEKLAKQREEDANIVEWDNIQAMINADYELAARLQEQELRAEEQRRKPPTKAQRRNQMCTYLKNMTGFTHSQLKSKNYDEIQKLFDKSMTKSVEVEVDDEAEMKKHMDIVSDDEVAIDAIPLATKPPIIIDWKIIKKEKMGYFQIIRADGSSKRPEEAYERVLWGNLKVMFEPDIESDVWRNDVCFYKL